MKTLLLLLLIAAVGCKKDTGRVPGVPCYKCTFGYQNGVNYPDSTICRPGFDPATRFYDAGGNQIFSQCLLLP